MNPFNYNREELLSEHDYTTFQEESGRRLHGGFDAEGRYISPRMGVRGPAIENWTRSLRESGGDLMQTDASLLDGIRYPNFAQSKLLLQEGLGQSFWNSLTITGHIEAQGQILAEMQFPDFQRVIVEDIGGMAVGHLHKGMLEAHGLDEGGEKSKGIGGHDEMWFALRDLAFGEVDYPEPEVPENIARPESDEEEAPLIDEGYHRVIQFLLNLLLIEFRAERAFALAEGLLRDPELFRDRRAKAEHAAVIVDRIRQDEAVHVESLKLYLGEIRHLTFKTLSGTELRGASLVDDFWKVLTRWATVEQPRLSAQREREMYYERISQHAESERVRRAFDALEERIDHQA